MILGYLRTLWRPKDRQLRRQIYTLTGRYPTNLSLYKLAFQHASTANNSSIDSNERLEFLGDAVLSLVVGEYLFKRFPKKDEGFLTEIRSRIVNRASLGRLARRLNLDTLLEYDKRILRRQGSGKFMYGNALEALIGAVYLDKGYKCSQRFVTERILGMYLDVEACIQSNTNYKSQIIEWASKQHKVVRFEILDTQTGTPNGKLFTAQVLIDGQQAGQGEGSNKKSAEQRAAQKALDKLSQHGQHIETPT